MNSYTRDRYSRKSTSDLSEASHRPSPSAEITSKKEELVKIDGFKQVLQMLEMADHAFRESLLKRLHSKDPQMARALRRYLQDLT